MKKIIYSFLCVQCLTASEVNFQNGLLENQKLQIEKHVESKEEIKSKGEEKKVSNIQEHSNELGDWTGHFFTKVGLIVHKPTLMVIGYDFYFKECICSEGANLYGYLLPGKLLLKVQSSSTEFIQALKDAGIYQE